MHPQRRRLRLIHPRIQLRLILSFLGVSVLALVLQYLVFMQVLAQVASELPNDGGLLLGEITHRLLWVLCLTSALLLPATLYVGVLATRRLVGPIYRFEMYLTQILEGKTRDDCRLRKGDELMDLCALINRATLPLRQPAGASASTATGRQEDPRAAA